MSKKIKILTPRIYEHSEFFHNAVDFAREHSLNTNELCLELSHYLVDNFEKIWKVEKPRVYKKLADLEEKIAEKDAEIEKVEKTYMKQRDYYTKEFNEVIDQLKQQLAEKETENTRLKLLVDSFDKLKQYDKDADLILINPKTCYTDGKELVVKADNQDKISFAVGKLEEVKWIVEDIQCTYGDDNNISRDFLIKEIDNKIKQLKGEK